MRARERFATKEETGNGQEKERERKGKMVWGQEIARVAKVMLRCDKYHDVVSAFANFKGKNGM